MKRTFFALCAAAIVGAAAPASALSLQFDLPRLSFPTQPAPDATQGCADLTTIKGDVCVATSE
ncbi:MAG: hypothetical protein AAFP85_02490 [Pseudomonadota bacterium]